MLKPSIIVFRGKGSQGEVEPLTAEIAESAEKNLAVNGNLQGYRTHSRP